MTIQRSDYGCGDNSCVFGSPGGMGTNGGCRCLSEMPRHALTDRLKVQRGIMALREKIAEDAKVRAGLVEAIELILHSFDDGPPSLQGIRLDDACKKAQELLAALAAAKVLE